MEPLKILRQLLAGKSQAKLAKEIGVSPAYLSIVMQGKKPPGPKVLRYLGLERVPVTYRLRQKKLSGEART